MNIATLSLILTNANYVQTSDGSTYAVGNAWLIQVDNKNQQLEFPIHLQAWGANAQLLTSLSPNENIFVIGEIWIGKEKTNLEVQEIIIGYVGKPINRIAVVGRQGMEPDTRFFESGTQLTKTSLAVNRKKDESYWFPVECWHKQAELLTAYGRKGDYLDVQGMLTIEQWVDSQSQSTKRKLKVKVNKFNLMGSKRQEVDEF